MQYVFFGTPEASKLVLERLVADGSVPVAIVTNPDRPAGRAQRLTPPPVKQFAIEKDLDAKILQPEKVIDAAEELSALRPDMFIVAFYGKLIPARVLAIPHLGTLGVHPSLLPLYRGPSPVQSAILDAVPETGVTVYRMDEKMDEGPIVAQKKLLSYHKGEKDNLALWHELAALGGTLAARALRDAAAGTLEATPQDHARATYTKKFSTEDAFIAESDLAAAKAGNDPARAQMIHQKILAFTPEPGAWTTENGKRLKLLESAIANGQLILKKIQYEGKKPMKV